MTSELCLLAKKYNVDKCYDIDSSWPTHTYTPAYHNLLKDSRLKPLIFLEIGIGTIELMGRIVYNYKPGASLRMWRDYMPTAQIFGCDIVPSVLFEEDRIKTFLADQSNQESLYNLYRQIYKETADSYIDIIMDDGSHKKDHQVFSFTHLWQFIRPGGGFYIIEDVNEKELDFFERLPLKLGFSDAVCVCLYRGEWDAGEGDNFIAFQKT